MLQNSKGNCLCSFVPGFGANILELQLESKGKCLQLLDGFKTDGQLTANEKSRSIHLVPFPNRVKDGRYFFEGKEFYLPINKPKEHNAIHGFIWSKPFKIVEEKTSASSADVELKYSYTGENEGFPFPFTVHYQYKLSEAAFSITVLITNDGINSMPLGIGWHPYFTFNKRVDKLLLKLPDCDLLENDDRLIPTGKRSSFAGFNSLQKIGTSAFDTVFELAGKGDHFETRLYDPESNATIVLHQDSSFRYLQVYIPSERNSIALEPMTCPANAFNSGEGLVILKPKDRYSGRMQVFLD